MNIRFFNPGLGYTKIKTEVLSEVDRVLTNGDLILRKDVEDFERNVAKYIGTKYAVGLNSCTDALYLSLKGLDIGEGDEVLVPSRTFVASVQVIIQVGAIPIFYDIDGTFSSSFEFTNRTKAIIPVHIEGAFDTHFDQILKMAKEEHLYIIEDAAQAFGATKDGRKAGSFGIAGCFSFYPAKTLGAYGDAGCLVTDDEKLYRWVKDVRNHFKEDARDWGVNSRLDNLQAAILNVKFKYYEQFLKRRREVAEKYLEELQGVQLPSKVEGRIWQDFIIRTEKRNELYDFLKKQDIETMKNNYPFPVPKLPLAQAYEDETLRLPCNESLTNEEVNYVIEKVNEFSE